MGLLNELSTINRTIENNQQKQLTKTEKAEQKRIRKQKLTILLKRKIAELFEEVQDIDEIEALTINLLKYKNENIQIIKDIYFEKYNIKLNNSEVDFLDEIYFKTIKKIKSEYIEIFKNDTSSKKEAKEEAKEEAKAIDLQQKKIAFSMIIKLLYTICIVLLSPFILIGFVIIAICKNK